MTYCCSISKQTSNARVCVYVCVHVINRASIWHGRNIQASPGWRYSYVRLNIPASLSSHINPYYLFTAKLHTYSWKGKQEISALVNIITGHGYVTETVRPRDILRFQTHDEEFGSNFVHIRRFGTNRRSKPRRWGQRPQSFRRPVQKIYFVSLHLRHTTTTAG